MVVADWKVTMPVEISGELAEMLRVDAAITELIEKSKGDVPDDVLALIAQIIIDENIERIPPIHWRKSRKPAGGTGRCYSTHVALTISPNTSQDLVHLLACHEMTHWIMRRENHSPFFYEKAFEMYERYGVSIEYAKVIEFHYKSYSARMGYALYMRAKGVKWTFADESNS